MIALVSPGHSTQARTIRVTKKGSGTACMVGDEGNLANVIANVSLGGMGSLAAGYAWGMA